MHSGFTSASMAQGLQWKACLFTLLNSMEQTAIKNLLDDLERRVAALRGYL